MTRPRFPLRAVAALFIERQQLDRPRGRRLTAGSLRSFVEAAGGLQIDTINVVDRAHYLTAWSRFGAFERAKLDRLIWRRKVLFEYLSHVACFVPATHFPAWRRAMLDYETKSMGWGSWLKKHAPTLKHVESTVREHGPLGSAHFEDERPEKRPAGWWNWKQTSHALDFLWKSGRIAVHSRRNFHKSYDLIERVHPKSLAAEPLSRDAFRRWHIERSLHAMGAATEPDLRMYMTFPRIKATERRTWVRRLVHEGAIVEIDVEGQRGPWFALPADLPALERAARKRIASRGTTMLSPFDSFLWYRERTRRLFGFDYTIEVYVPGHKRVHGYYALPIWHDGQFIGRLDSKTHRERGELEVKRVYFEPWFVAGDSPPAASWGRIDQEAALQGVAEAVHSLATFVQARRVKLGKVVPSRLRAPFARALREAAPHS